MGWGGLRIPPHARPPLLQVRGFCGGGRQRLPGNFPRSVSGDKSRAGGQATKGPRPPRVVAWAAWLQAGHGLGGYVQRGARKCGEPGSCGAPGELSTLRSRSENFAAAAREGSRGVTVRPRGRCWWWLGEGALADWGLSVRVFVLFPSPHPRSRETAARAGLQPPGSPTPTPCFPRARPGPVASLLPTPRLVGAVPCPSPCRRWLPRPRRWEGDRIRRPLLALPFFPSLALPAPPGCTSPPPALPGGRQR